MKVVFSNDDFGLSYGFCEAIKDCYLRGVTTSVSLTTNGEAFSYAVELLKNELKGIGLGVHLNLTDGYSLTKIKELTGPNEKYNRGFLGLCFSLICSKDKEKLIKSISKEFELQIQKVIDTGLIPDHLDSDKHIHMIPAIFEIVCILARKYKIPFVRLVREPFYLTKPFYKNVSHFTNLNLLKWLLLNSLSKVDIEIAKNYKVGYMDSFFGVLNTNNMEVSSIISALHSALRRKFELIEIVSHPAYIDDKRDIIFISERMKKYSKEKKREKEARTMKKESLFTFLEKQAIERVSFRDLI